MLARPTEGNIDVLTLMQRATSRDSQSLWEAAPEPVLVEADLVKSLAKDAESLAAIRSRGFTLFTLTVIVASLGVYASAYYIGIARWPDTDGPSGAAAPDNRNTSPVNKMSDEDLQLLSSIVLWLSVVVAGLGSELVLGELLVVKLAEVHEAYGTALWHSSQLFFSLFVSISFFAASPLGLPFLVIGMWKFGFPETTSCFRRAWLHGVSIKGLSSLLGGLGTVLHHTASAWTIVGLTTGLFVRGRPMIACTLPIVAQHLGILLKYHSLPLPTSWLSRCSDGPRLPLYWPSLEATTGPPEAAP